MELHERIFEIALSRLIFYPSNEIYGNIAGFYDYGPIGLEIKNNIVNTWRKYFIKEENAYEVETSIVTPSIVLEASGHVQEFTDPVAECGFCNYKTRADKLAEEQIKNFEWKGSIKELNEVKEKLKCPKCGNNIKDIYSINLMFPTVIGYDNTKAYLRPETAQGIFTSFPRFYKIAGKLPFAIAQVGRSFRNEISPRKGLIRLREFHQMEFEYFFNPKFQNHEKFSELSNIEFLFKHRQAEKPVKETALSLVKKGICSEIFAYYLAKQWLFFTSIGLKDMWFRHLESHETPHYSKGNIDLEVKTSYGIIEIAGNAYRTDYDLRRHAEYSKQNLNVTEDKESFIPHVFETSIGVERTLFCVLEHCFVEKTNEREWAWFKFPSLIAPYHLSIFPLVQNVENIVNIARDLKQKAEEQGLKVFYFEKGSIGKRYAKSDEIGIPYAITVDHESIEDGRATIRFRDNAKQVRVAFSEIIEKIKTYLKRDIQEI
jgi:glycyl-tRNA synthetase